MKRRFFVHSGRSDRTRVVWLLAALLLGALVAACSTTTSTPDVATDTTIVESTGCVETYDPKVDYFPTKINLTYAEGWAIEYFNHYKVITVLTPWKDAEHTFQYVLVQCGTPAPEGFPDAQIIEVPTRRIVTMSTTYLSHLDKLDLLDRLVGVDNPQFINTPDVVQMIEQGKLATIGSGAEVNIERILELDPTLVMTYGTGSPENDTHPHLLAAGVPVAINAEYMESTPLGYAEWFKFTAAFFNQEAAAEQQFADIATQYEELAAQARAVGEQPTVLMNAPFQGTWYVPGGNNYSTHFLADAGSAYLWADDGSSGSLSLSFEAVLERAANADYWLNPGTATTLEEMLTMDERLGSFAAVQAGTVYNNNKRVNKHGGNDYWESGVTNPHIILADLVAIFHPELLPDHELYYYQQVQ